MSISVLREASLFDRNRRTVTFITWPRLLHTVISPTFFRSPFLCQFVLVAHAAGTNSLSRPQTICRAVCASTAEINNVYVCIMCTCTHIRYMQYARSFDQLFCLTVASSNDCGRVTTHITWLYQLQMRFELSPLKYEFVSGVSIESLFV